MLLLDTLVFSLIVFGMVLCLLYSSSFELSMEGLRCLFLGIVIAGGGVYVLSVVVSGGAGVAGISSGDERAPIFGLRSVKFGGGMFRAGEVLGGLMVLGLGEDEVEREGSGAGADFLALSSRF